MERIGSSSLDPDTATNPEPSQLETGNFRVPFKVSITGKTVAVCLLPLQEEPGGEPGNTHTRFFPQSGMVAPLLVSAMYNPLCGLQCDHSGKWTVQASLFNMAVGHNKGMDSICESL